MQSTRWATRHRWPVTVSKKERPECSRSMEGQWALACRNSGRLTRRPRKWGAPLAICNDRSTPSAAVVRGSPAFAPCIWPTVKRCLPTRGAPLRLTPRPGFGDLVDYSEAEKATGRNGVAFQDAIKRLHIADTKVECLTAEGHRTALDQFAGLKDEKPPAGLNGVQVADWRDARAAAKVLAREAATAARSGQPARPVGKRGKGRGAAAAARACIRPARRILGPS